MIEYRLLVDLEAVVELDSLPKRDRSRLLLFFEKLRSYPEHYASADERDDRGRRIDIASHAGWLIYYWTDFADRHVKIMKIRRVAGGTRLQGRKK
ncbi:hypothetical protein [Prosthecobacter sp.]|uniref:hypothetical protein n=1 Tax=Prosthecobacter sp. TaxID=1965333 RepID=UPI002AB985D9|nr:hypothetical protein [Prosthecobacter sp.]MDZ4403729.1 hypothetical protein [Prosthecobacter sp.]